MKIEKASIIEMERAARTATQHIHCQLWKIINWITTRKTVDPFNSTYWYRKNRKYLTTITNSKSNTKNRQSL